MMILNLIHIAFLMLIVTSLGLVISVILSLGDFGYSISNGITIICIIVAIFTSTIAILEYVAGGRAQLGNYFAKLAFYILLNGINVMLFLYIIG